MMKDKCFIGHLFTFFLLCFLSSQVAASENFGLYKKLYDDGDESVYELVWSGYDSDIYEEPTQPGDFVIQTAANCDDGGDVVVICPNSFGSMSTSGPLERIIVVGRRPASDLYIWVFELMFGGGDWGSWWTERFGRVADFGQSGQLGQYKRLGSIAINAQQWAELAAATLNLTIEWGLADIRRFRDVGLHVPNPQGSLIPWQDAQVDWNEFGAADPGLSDEDVLSNLINALSGP